MYRSTAYLLDVLFFVFAQRSGAQTTDVDSVATEIARLHNLSADALLDDITVSTSAMAVGKNVIVTDHLKVTASEHSLEALLELKAKRKEKIVARTCKANERNEAFKKGLYYTFNFLDSYGRRITAFDVDFAACRMK